MKQNKINEWLMIIIFIEYNINIKTLHLILDFCLSFNNFLLYFKFILFSISESQNLLG